MTASIADVADLCAAQRALSLDLFEQLGATITSLPVDRQRIHAEAAHRHAWHAELWAARSPAIPTVDLDAKTAEHRTDVDLLADYTGLLTQMAAELDEWNDRIDRDLDPSTARAISLVSADLRELRDRLT